MRSVNTPLLTVVESFLIHRHELSPATIANYNLAFAQFDGWVQLTMERPAEIADIEPGTVEAYLVHRIRTVSAQSARSAWVALRSLATFLAQRRILADHGDSTLRLVRQPKVKDDARRALTDQEMWKVIERARDGEMGERDVTIVLTLLGCGLRRAELVGLRLQDVDLRERKLSIRATTSKSVHSRDVTIPVETLKALDNYITDHRDGDADPEAPLFLSRRGGAMNGNAVRKLFDRLKVRTNIGDLCAHMHRHTWGTNFHRSGSGSRFDLMVEGGWTTSRMVERYVKARPFEERRKAPSPFTAARKRRADEEKRPAEKRPPQQRSGLSHRRIA